MKNMNKYFIKDLKEISAEEYNHIFEINRNLEPLHYKFDDFEYWIIKDVLVRPEKANKFILDNYVIIEREHENNQSHHPNKQLVYPEFTFYNIKELLMRFISENEILEIPTIHYQDLNTKIKLDKAWHTYSNLAYKNVKIRNRNHEPHTDGFTMGCNLFLTHNGVGTSLFKKKYNDELIISAIEGFAKYGKEFVNHISKYYRIRADDDTIIDGWINVEEDDNWLRHYTIPGEFNTISMYKGSYFHSPHISDTLEDDEIRHNLVFGYFSQTNEEEDNYYEREVEKWNYKKKT